MLRNLLIKPQNSKDFEISILVILVFINLTNQKNSSHALKGLSNREGNRNISLDC